MIYPRINKNNPRIRTALLEAHNNRCFYTDRPLNYEDMEVDHVIPENLESDMEMLHNLFADLDLPANFSLHCFHNLVPTSKKINNRKSGELFPIKETRTYLNLAAKQFSKFEKRLEVAEARAKRSNLRQTIDLLTDESPYYEEVLDIGEDACTISKKHLRLQAYLPKHPEVRGSCLITFKSVMLRDCMITFSHKDILSDLFRGAHSRSSFSLRGFFVGEHQGKYFVQLGNNRFALSLEEIEELCWALDELEKVYVNKLAQIEQVLETRWFSRSRASSVGLRLIRTNSSLWNRLIKFSEEFDVANGVTRWHIFDYNPYALKIYGDRSNPNLASGYHAMIRPERLDGWEAPSFRLPDDKLHLNWEPIEGLGEGSLSDYSNDRLWNPKKTHDWLVEELIPYVLFHQRTKRNKRGLFSRVKTEDYASYSKSFDPDIYFVSGCAEKSLRVNDIKSSQDCVDVVQSLQSHFHPNESLYLRADVIKKLYMYIIELLEKDPLSDYGYIIGNMSRRGAADRDQLIKELTEYVSDLSDGSYGSAVLDYAFRSILEIIRHGSVSFDGAEAEKLAEQLSDFWSIKERREMLRRFEAR